jgi:alpha-1,2-mannosyltransferase
MKILLIHPRLSIKGGGERVAIHSILAATKAGHQVSLLSEEFDEAGFEDFYGCSGLFNKVNRLCYPAFKPILGSQGLLYQRLIYNWFQIRKVATLNTYELVLSTQDVAYVPTVHAPVVQYCHFPEYFWHLESQSSVPFWRFYYWPATRFYRDRVRRVRTFLSNSDFTRGFVRNKWHRDATTVYPPCPIEMYDNYSKSSAREELVVTIGRVSPEKRFDLFLDLARMVPNTKFVIVGTVQLPRYYEYLRQRAPDNVSFVLSPLRKVRDILGRATAYVHCAVNEHFGITIVEAMAAGCVPIVHDSGGPREIVTEDVGFRWSDLRTAADCISRLSGDDQLRERLSVAAAARAKRFSPETFESEMLKLFEEHGSRTF